MSEYRIRSSGEIKTKSEIRQENPNVSFPKVWGESVYEALEIDPVLGASAPDPSRDYKVVVRNSAEQNSDGDWVQAWAERDMTDEEKAAHDQQKSEEERRARDGLLRATDHYGLSDITMTEAMTAYRQALRDVPQQAGFPSTITWPTKPE